MKIVFFGTSSFAAEVLTHLAKQQNIHIAAVVTRPDRPQGRSLRLSPSPVNLQARNILPETKIFQPEKASTAEFAQILGEFAADLFVVVAYGEIIKENLLSLPPLGCINIHASLLPKYRGAAPMQRCLMEGEEVTGITIIEMVKGLDAGPMIEQVSVTIDENTTFGELEQLMLEAACRAIDNALCALAEKRVIKKIQDESKVTYAAKILPPEEKIVWSSAVKDLHNKIRALSPKPGAWCPIYFAGHEKRLKIKRTRIRKDFSQVNKTPGTILEKNKNSLVVACSDGALELLEVQLEGKKSLPISEFLRGFELISFSF